MFNRAKLAACFIVVFLSACSATQPRSDNQAEVIENGKPELNEKCKAAKQDLDSAVKAGDRDNVHELKRNIELYCVWRRY